jgi:hypothetical protein
MKLERSIPAPVPDDANERAHRVDAEAEEFMAEHAEGIIRAWNKYGGDLTAYGGWDEAAVRKHWPELWTRWRNLEQAKTRLGALIDNELNRRWDSTRGRFILDPGTK